MKICSSCSCVNDSINRYCRNCGKPFESENTNEIQEELSDNALTPTGSDDNADDTPEQNADSIPKDDILLTENIDDSDIPIPRAIIDFDFGDKETPESIITEEHEELANPEKLYSTHPVINIMKRVGAGGTFLSVCIFSTVFSLASFVWLYQPEVNSWLRNPYNMCFKMYISSIIILFTLGAWIYFGACSNRKRNYASTGGLSVINAANIVGIASSTVIGLISVFVLLSAFTFHNIGISALFLSGFALFVLVIIYFSMGVITVKRLKTCATNGTPAKLPVYIIVMNYCVAALASPGIGYFLATGRIIELIMTVSFMLMMICLSGAMISYRRQIKKGAE